MTVAKPQPTKSQKAMAFLFVGCLVAVIAFIELKSVPAFFAPKYEPKTELSVDQLHNHAFVMAQGFVSDRLKAPADEDFPATFDAGAVRHHGDGLYTVSSYVDAPKTFGAKLRTRYVCKLQTTDKGETWNLMKLDFS